eukprot:TRINITY_DN27910_c0_g1_i1.p1 TRINITY_DN27910_c0_g1~~TRINITY_DN27910_c0_g1_i1.p1  ORF type:complete len:450 (+),score=86.63 TRINITY_DN27910_c0_g1_i1:158-1507(+)
MACQKTGLASLRDGLYRYLVEFASNHLEFRLPELQAVAEVCGIDIHVDPESYSLESPYLIFDSPSPPTAITALSRSMAIHYVAELWGYGLTWDACLQRCLREQPASRYQADSFRFRFASFNRKLSKKRTQAILAKLEVLPFEGRVDLTQASVVHVAVEDYGARDGQTRTEPVQVFLATFITEGCRDLIMEYDLKTRNMIGNTSMDPELSFLMANMVKARPGTLMMDPFCGTASLLLPLAHFGAHVMGTDIAFIVIHGIGKTSRHNTGQKERGPNENIRANFAQYGCTGQFVDAFVADTAKPCIRDDVLFDAIVADPPYGIREPARKIGVKDKDATVPEEFRGNRFPRSEAYQLGAVFKDLLGFAAQRLVVKGRLSFWMPEVLADPFEPPTHPCMQLIANSQQPLSRKLARRMLTYEKTSDDVSGSVSASFNDDWKVRHAVFDEETQGKQ